MLTTTTHSKLKEALDGTDTQVATCVIDRWTAKMKRTEGYITREISQKEGDGNSEDARKFYWWSIRRGEEEIILDRGPRTSFDLSPNHTVDDSVPQRSCPTVEGVLTKARFSSPLLYQIHCIGPVGFGFGFAHIYSERSPPNQDPTIGAVCGKNLGASENDKSNRAEPNPQEGTMMANLLDREWRTVEGFPARRASSATRVALGLTRGRMTRHPHGRPPSDPGGGRRRSRETLSRGSTAGTVFEDRCWCLLAHSSGRIGL